MTLDALLGWSVLLSLLLAASAAMIMPVLWQFERVVPLGRARWFARGAAIAAGALALWYAIPLVVHALYHTNAGIGSALRP
jgi:hypothetical protein